MFYSLHFFVDKKPTSDWPNSGEIKFQNVFLSYENKDVLKNLNFEIQPSEKIAIVGRTGFQLLPRKKWMNFYNYFILFKQ